MAKPQKASADVFLNIPYDRKFENLFLAHIAGISALGLNPRATLEIRGSTRRLEKILKLIESCRYSIHDLSRVELDTTAPRTPRFNMPFELGLSVAYQALARGSQHSWYVFEAVKLRLPKSLSDLNGTDPHIHGGTIRGVFRELCEVLERPERPPTIQEMGRIYREMRGNLPQILQQSGADSPFRASVFRKLSVVASVATVEVMK